MAVLLKGMMGIMQEDFNDLLQKLKKCEICKEKFGFQPHPIFLGNINSKIVQISQAPSATVHETLKPFTDQSGKKLKYEWYMINDAVFIIRIIFILLLLPIVILEKIKMVMISYHQKFVMKLG